MRPRPPLLSSIFPLSLLWASILVVPAHAAALEPQPRAAASNEYTSDSAFKNAVLNVTNTYRREYNASDLAWNATSAKYAEKWAGKCVFEHSGGPTGENLAAGYPNATTSIAAWGDESSSFDFSNPDFTKETGHFSQLVWKDTTSVGCGRKQCDGKGDNKAPGWFVVCEYYPPGNVIGEFKLEVNSKMNGAEGWRNGGKVGWWVLLVGWAGVWGAGSVL